MSDHLTPVQVCERLIGPLAELERIVGYKPKAAYAWLRSSGDRDAGYFPSVRLMQRMLAHAAARKIPLTAEHLIWGADAAEIAELAANTAPPMAAFASSRVTPPAIEAAE